MQGTIPRSRSMEGDHRGGMPPAARGLHRRPEDDPMAVCQMIPRSTSLVPRKADLARARSGFVRREAEEGSRGLGYRGAQKLLTITSWGLVLPRRSFRRAS